MPSRNGNTFDRFETLARQVAADLGASEAILDGEVIAPDETGGRSSMISCGVRGCPPRGPLPFWGCSTGADLRSMPLGERRKRLQTILSAEAPIISEALSVTGRGREIFELMCSNDLEGIVAKRLGDPYDPRVRWLKIKNPDYSQKEGRGDLFNAPRPPAHRRRSASRASP